MQNQTSEIIVLAVVTTIVLLFLLSFIAAVLFLYQKKSIIYFKQLEDIKNEYEKNLLQAQLEIQEQTFQDISREIHDNIGLSLTLAKLQLNTINYTEKDKILHNVDSSIDLISKAIQDLSDISKSLNSELIKDKGLYNTLKTAIEKINQSGKYNVEISEEGDIVFLDGHKELILYRIAQEALNNILKHASAHRITIQLKYEPQRLNLLIEDDGIGFNLCPLGKNHSDKINNGITNMRTRAIILDGTFRISSRIGKGTSIFITVPY